MSEIVKCLQAIANDDRYGTAASLAIAEVRRLEDECRVLRDFKVEIDESFRAVMNEPCDSDDRMHCTCVPALRHEMSVMFSVISEECEHHGGAVEYEDGEDGYEGNLCTFENDGAYRECSYAMCPLLNQARAK